MPRKIIKYGCGFRCGHVSFHKIEQAIAHEKECWKNPDSKTCETCNNKTYQFNGDSEYPQYMRGCLHPKMDKFFDDLDDKLRAGNGKHVKPVFNCPNWNNTFEHEYTDNFIDTITKKILHIEEENKNNSTFFDFLLI